MSSPNTVPLLQLAEIRKTYPGVKALDGVTLSAAAGEVLGLIGENGAGKSTLMKILGGVTTPDSGQIIVDGRAQPSLSVTASMAAGIAFVHQELNLFDNLDVAANIYIGREPLCAGLAHLVDTKALHRRVQPLLDRLGVDFAPDKLVAELSLAQRQLLEIAKALSLDARLVIMDEPTSSLTISETERLLAIIEDLKSDGISVIFISHRLGEVERCADRVIVLRDGRIAGELGRQEIDHDRMIRLMIGRDLRTLYIPPTTDFGPVVLKISGARTSAYPQSAVNLELRSGEILGLAGLMGSGRTELARAIFGIDSLLGGTVLIAGQAVTIRSAREAIDLGLYLVPEDRKHAGLLLDMAVSENISLPDLVRYTRGFLVQRRSEETCADRQRERLGIKTPSLSTKAATLSGGNQQKVVLAKWLAMQPKVIIFDEPTRGIDVGAKSEIYRLMRDLADSGVAVLMISSDMEEVIGVSDRIAVMRNGSITGFLDRSEFSEENVLFLAVGKSPKKDLVTC